MRRRSFRRRGVSADEFDLTGLGDAEEEVKVDESGPSGSGEAGRGGGEWAVGIRSTNNRRMV